METIGFIIAFYLSASLLLYVATVYRNWNYYVKLAAKKTDEDNKELDERMERGEVTPMDRDARLETYSQGLVKFLVTQAIRSPFDAPFLFMAIMLDAQWDDDEPEPNGE